MRINAFNLAWLTACYCYVRQTSTRDFSNSHECNLLLLTWFTEATTFIGRLPRVLVALDALLYHCFFEVYLPVCDMADDLPVPYLLA